MRVHNHVEAAVSDLTREERGRVATSFLITTGLVAVVTVLFALIGQLSSITIILGVLGTIAVSISLVLRVSSVPVVVAYATLFDGIGVIVGAAGGYLIVTTVISLLH